MKPRSGLSIKASILCYGACTVRHAFNGFYRTAPHRTVSAPHRTAPHESRKQKSAPHRTVRLSQTTILTAPPRTILEIEKPHRGSVLHREKPRRNTAIHDPRISPILAVSSQILRVPAVPAVSNPEILEIQAV